MMQYVALEDTVYLYFSVNNTSGDGSDGDVVGTGTGSGEADFVVREGGASQSAAPTYTGWPYLLTHASYPAGCYELAVPATAANGFTANKTYAVFCTLTVSSVNPTGYVGSFRTAPVPANTTQWLGTAPATPNVAGVPKVDVTHSLGVAITHEDFTLTEASGSNTITIPSTDSTSVSIPNNDQYEYCVFRTVGGTGKNQIILTTTAVAGTSTATDREYNVVPGTMPAALDTTTKLIFMGSWRGNVTHLSGDSAAADNAESFFDGTGYAGTGNTIPTVTSVTNTVNANVVQISGDATAADNLESYTDGTTPMPVNVTQFGGSNGTFNSGRPEVNTTHFGGTAGTFSSGRPEVNATHWGGTAVASAVVNANAVQVSGDATAADNLEAAYDGTGYAHINNTYPWTAAWDAEVQSEVQDALEANNLDHLLKIAVDTSWENTVHLDSVIGHIASDGTGTGTVTGFNRTTHSLEFIGDNVGGAGGTDWSATEREQIRYRLGIDGTESAPVTNTDLNLGTVSANVTQISGDATAADNAESFFDGTGYAGTNNVIPLVTATTTVTNMVTANVIQISGDTTSADNLESYTDGTTPMPVNVTQFGGTNGTFSGGRPETNTTHWGGTAVASAVVNTNVIQISGDSAAADNLEAAYDGTGYSHTGNTYPWTAAWDAEIQSEVQDAIEANNLDHLIKLAVDATWDNTVHVDSVIGYLATDGTGTGTTSGFNRTQHSLEYIGDNTGGAGGTDWTANERTAIRSILGIPASGTTPDDPTTGILDTIRDRTMLLATQASVDTIDDFLDTEIAEIKAKTDNLPADPADASDIAASFSTVNSALSTLSTSLATVSGKIDTVDDYLDTEIAAIKVKTDQLTFTTTNRVDCQVHGMQASTLTASALATDAAQEIADTVLGRSVSGSEASAAEHSLCSIILAMLESSVSGTTWTINRTNGTTTHLTKTLTTTSSADPITGVS